MQLLREEQLDIGAVRVLAEAHSLTLRQGDGAELRLDVDGVVELFRFLRSVLINPTDRRSAYRIPVPSADGFRATMSIGTLAIPAEARNLSLTGVLLQPSLPDTQELELGAIARVGLQFEGESVIAEAAIRRRAGSEYGLSFLNAGRGDEFDPLPRLARMMIKLERYWAMEGWKQRA